MAEKDIVFKGKITEKGVTDFQGIYSFSYDWLNSEGYKVTEKKYGEKVVGDSKELDIEWEATRKISDYFKFTIKINWRIFNLKKVEVQRDGQKVKLDSGMFEIKLEAVLVKDYEHRWEDAPIWKFLRGVYDKYLIRGRIDSYEDKLKEEVEELIAQLKAFLAIEGRR